MRIGVIAAMKHEMDLILDEIESLEKEVIGSYVFHYGLIGENEVYVVECGVGKVNAAIATTLLISKFECEFIINTGIAGGISPLETKDVVIGKKLIYSDFDATIFNYEVGQVPGMPKYYSPSEIKVMVIKKILNKLSIPYKEDTIYTGDSFITSMDQLKKVNATSGATEMEGCAVAQTATRFGVDFIVIRYISDIIGKDNQELDYLTFETEMAERSAKITIEILKNVGVEND